MHCKDCKWWGCKNNRADETERICYSPKMGDNLRPFDDRSKSGWGVAESFYGGRSDIETGPDFGCIHWEAKDG